MAERNQKVYERVLDELKREPGLGSRELYTKLQSADKSIGKDSLQQFHARYVLPAKREQKGEGGQGAPKRSRQPRSDRGRPRRKGGEGGAESGAASSSTQAPTRRRRGRRAQQESASREQIRAALLQFAQELTDAESRSSLVKVLGKVDSYVDRIATATSR